MLIITLWLVQWFFVHQQLSIPHLQNKGPQFDNREQSMREIDTFNLQQLQVHYFMVNCRCPFFPPLKTKGTESKKGKRRLKSLPQWKRKTIWTKPQFWISACFQPYVWRRIPWKSCHFQSETVSSRLCLLLFTRQVSKKENCWYQQNSIATSITSGASPSTFLGIPYWIILRGFLRFCCHQFYTTHLRISVRGHCRMQLKSEDSNETLRSWVAKLKHSLAALLSYPTEKQVHEITKKNTSDPWIRGSGVLKKGASGSLKPGT